MTATRDGAGGVDVLVVDGNSLLYRAFHALPDSLRDGSGRPVGAVYGLVSMLVRLLGDVEPVRVVVAWDEPAVSFRYRLDSGYKAGRVGPPDALAVQMPLARAAVAALGLCQVSDPDFEADDVVASVVELASRAGLRSVVVSGDRDVFQLVSDRVEVWWTRRGVSDVVVVTSEWVRERFGVEPRQWVEFVALRGDASDGIRGVPGVGEKTAARWLQQFGSLEALFAGVGEVSPRRFRDVLPEWRERVALNVGLVALCREVPSVPSLESWRWGGVGDVDVFDDVGLGGLRRRVSVLRRRR